MRRAALACLLVTGLLVAVLGACTAAAQPCYPGDYVACACASGSRGLSQCAADGTAYGVCDCSGNVPGSAATPDAGSAETSATDGGKLPFSAACSSNDECATGDCFRYNAKGPHCSMPCKVDAECPAPSPGCNMMGVCKAP